ncbi:MAG: hypothetical protein FWE22_01515 [Firmicutes bacterium]|nr:hypothetical protein [Bacillota bacterium]
MKKKILLTIVVLILASLTTFMITACDYSAGDDCIHESWGEWVEISAPTCTMAGRERRECANAGCSHYTTRTGQNALGHNMGGWTESFAPTCVSVGIESGTCQREGCDHFDTRTGRNALGHNLGEWVEISAPICTVAGIDRRECYHVGCNHYETREQDALGHDWEEWVIVTVACCIEDGLKTRACQRDCCNEDEVVETHALGHDMGVWKETRPPNETEDGEEMRTCQRDNCNFYENRPIILTPRFVVAAGGEHHSLAIDTQGNLWAWGSNAQGQLGDGTNMRRYTPVQINTGGRMNNVRVVFVVARGNHSMAIDEHGNLWSWGNNANGQLGDGTTIRRYVPVQVNTSGRMNNADIVYIAQGSGHSLAIDEHGNLWSWGINALGQLGVGRTNTELSNSTTPLRVNYEGRMNNARIRSIAAEATFSLAIDEHGNLWQWGRITYGLPFVENPILFSRSYPVRINIDGNMDNNEIVEVSVGNRNALAIDIYGNLWAWGCNSDGRLGNGQNQNISIGVSMPVLIKTGVKIRLNNDEQSGGIATGSGHSLIIDEHGDLWGWGLNSSGQVGDYTITRRTAPVQINMSGRINDAAVVFVVAGNNHTLVIDEHGNLWTWGSNMQGQLGDGTTTVSRVPLLIQF